MELKETVNLMLSDDYKERFAAEYWQTKIRYQRLHKMLTKFEAGKLGFELKCPAGMLKEQKRQMGEYLHTLEIRAEIEGIDLDATKECERIVRITIDCDEESGDKITEFLDNLIAAEE